MFILALVSLSAAGLAAAFSWKSPITDDDRLARARAKLADSGARIPRGSRREAHALAVLLDGGEVHEIGS